MLLTRSEGCYKDRLRALEVVESDMYPERKMISNGNNLNESKVGGWAYRKSTPESKGSSCVSTGPDFAQLHNSLTEFFDPTT